MSMPTTAIHFAATAEVDVEAAAEAAAAIVAPPPSSRPRRAREPRAESDDSPQRGGSSPDAIDHRGESRAARDLKRADARGERDGRGSIEPRVG